MIYSNQELLHKFDKSLHYICFVAFLNKKVKVSHQQQTRFAYRMSKGNASLAYLHPKTKEGANRPHMHILIGLREQDVTPYIENVFSLFEANNQKQRFDNLDSENVQTNLHDWRGMFLYISNEWNARQAEWRFMRPHCERDKCVTAT